MRVRKWKRVETADGRPFSVRSGRARGGAAEEPGRLDDRTARGTRIVFAADELEQITGMKTGNSEPPDNATLRRLLPDFSKPDDDRAAETADSLNAALRSLHEPAIIDAKRVAAQQLLDTLPDDGGKLRADRGRRERLDRGGQRPAPGPGHHARHPPGRPRSPARRPSAGRRTSTSTSG